MEIEFEKVTLDIWKEIWNFDQPNRRTSSYV